MLPAVAKCVTFPRDEELAPNILWRQEIALELITPNFKKAPKVRFINCDILTVLIWFNGRHSITTKALQRPFRTGITNSLLLSASKGGSPPLPSKAGAFKTRAHLPSGRKSGRGTYDVTSESKNFICTVGHFVCRAFYRRRQKNRGATVATPENFGVKRSSYALHNSTRQAQT